MLRFIDGIATRDITLQSRESTTAERYEAALTDMEAAVDSHKKRLRIRHVAKQLGVNMTISHRDRPNLSAIARVAAKAHRVSVNRLLARYRSSH